VRGTRTHVVRRPSEARAGPERGLSGA